MARSCWLRFVCLALPFVPAGLASAREDPVGRALVHVDVSGPKDIRSFEDATVPAYARLRGRAGEYLLAGAAPGDVETLTAAGLVVRVLDSQTAGARYYLAYPMPGRTPPDWAAFGRLLLDDGTRVLLRTSSAEAARLAEAGAEIRLLSLDPKPLHPFPARLPVPATVVPEPVIQLMIDQVDLGTVQQYDGGLSGEWPVMVGGSPYTILTRHTNSGEPIAMATQVVGQHLQALGLPVEYHTWDSPMYPNVIGELTGLSQPGDVFIISAHLDDMPPGTLAPGADDNASGSTAVLVAADILSQFSWDCTLRFAFWTGEEQGLHGSQAYAQRAFNSGENIVGVLNLDMIGWDAAGSPNMDLHAKTSLPQTQVLAQLFADVVAAYNLNLIPEIKPNGTGASDHASFWAYGYTAILGIEDGGDFNAYYHTVNDRLEHLNLPYFTEMVKAAVATFAHMSGCLVPVGVGALEGLVTDGTTGTPIPGATVTIAGEGGGGQQVATTDGNGFFSYGALLAGTYDVTVSAYGYLLAVAQGVLVADATTTFHDLSLTAAPTHLVTGEVIDAANGLPVHATVAFQPSPVAASTDGASGTYAAPIAEGTYTAVVTAHGYQGTERAVAIRSDSALDFALTPRPCALLVDDDGNVPDVQAYYTETLDALGVDYDVWDLSTGTDPEIGDIQGYRMLFWYTGRPWDNTFNSANETAVAAYLDAGGALFLSSKDYLFDAGLTPFGQTYLGITNFVDNVNQTDALGVAGNPVGHGLGPYFLTRPTGWAGSIYPDSLSGPSTPFQWQGGGEPNSTNTDSGTYKTVFLAWPLECVAPLASRTEILGAVVDYFGGCVPAEGSIGGSVTDTSGRPLIGAEVATGTIRRFVTFTDTFGTYLLRVPPGYHEVTASRSGFQPATVGPMPVFPGEIAVENLVLEPTPVPPWTNR